MSNTPTHFTFQATLWQHKGPAAWCFVTLPFNISEEIRATHKNQEQGWGRLPITAQINASQWQTAIWFDTKLNAYLLPIKANIRKKEALKNGDDMVVHLWLL